MEIIPVIDIKDGLVVSAQQGQRDTYRPIKSLLCSLSTVESVLNGYLSVHAFSTIYIADLNAITNTGNNYNLINQVITENKDIDFWVDDGKKIQDLSKPDHPTKKSIIGSEYQDITAFQDKAQPIKNNILSLDFFPNQGYTGPNELLENSTLWPQDIIIMSLECVGKNTGPDIARLKFFAQKHPDKNFIAAGGVRNEKDLFLLKKIGINYALIASALHSGTITAKEIKNLQAKKYPD
jgi:phosphoribosylformimino-5-aminoimidazole carboxamide ribotide isomerase